MSRSHLVGWDPGSRRVVVLRKGATGHAARQVDVLTTEEAQQLALELEGIAWMVNVTGEPTESTTRIPLEPDPAQVELDIPEE